MAILSAPSPFSAPLRLPAALRLSRRALQCGVHPTAVLQRIHLTDGSTVTVTSVTGRPPLRLTVDAASHPSWNAHLLSRMMLGESGQVARFNDRYGGDLGAAPSAAMLLAVGAAASRPTAAAMARPAAAASAPPPARTRAAAAGGAKRAPPGGPK